jgi:two-component system, cell cycle sensor histidine kinase and response regulator CckA
MPLSSRGSIVLLVDDDDMLRELLARTLADAGYSVITASDGDEALALASTLHEELGLVVTDIRMPVMDGLTLAANLAEFRPPPAILFISGFAGPAQLPGPFLTKPFLPTVFLKQVAAMMGATAREG